MKWPKIDWKIVVISTLIVGIVDCAHVDTTKDFIVACKTVCKHGVKSYTDDVVDCQCKS